MDEKQTFKCSFCEEFKEKVIIHADKESLAICYDCAKECKKLIQTDSKNGGDKSA